MSTSSTPVGLQGDQAGIVQTSRDVARALQRKVSAANAKKCWAGLLAGCDAPLRYTAATSTTASTACAQQDEKGVFEGADKQGALQKHTCPTCKTGGIYMDASQQTRLFAVSSESGQWIHCWPNSLFGTTKGNTVPCKLIAESDGAQPAILVLAPGASFGPSLPEGVKPLFDAKPTWFDQGGLPLVAEGGSNRFTFRPLLCDGWKSKWDGRDTAAAGVKRKARAGPAEPMASAAGSSTAPAVETPIVTAAVVEDGPQLALHVIKVKHEAVKQDRDRLPHNSDEWHAADREVDLWAKAVSCLELTIASSSSVARSLPHDSQSQPSTHRSLGSKGMANSPESSPESSPKARSLGAASHPYRGLSCSVTKSLSDPSVKQEDAPPVYRGGSALNRAEVDDDDETPRMRSLGATPSVPSRAEANKGADARCIMSTVIAALQTWALEADDYEVAERLASRLSDLGL